MSEGNNKESLFETENEKNSKTYDLEFRNKIAAWKDIVDSRQTAADVFEESLLNKPVIDSTLKCESNAEIKASMKESAKISNELKINNNDNINNDEINAHLDRILNVEQVIGTKDKSFAKQKESTSKDQIKPFWESDSERKYDLSLNTDELDKNEKHLNLQKDNRIQFNMNDQRYNTSLEQSENLQMDLNIELNQQNLKVPQSNENLIMSSSSLFDDKVSGSRSYKYDNILLDKPDVTAAKQVDLSNIYEYSNRSNRVTENSSYLGLNRENTGIVKINTNDEKKYADNIIRSNDINQLSTLKSNHSKDTDDIVKNSLDKVITPAKVDDLINKSLSDVSYRQNSKVELESNKFSNIRGDNEDTGKIIFTNTDDAIKVNCNEAIVSNNGSIASRQKKNNSFTNGQNQEKICHEVHSNANKNDVGLEHSKISAECNDSGNMPLYSRKDIITDSTEKYLSNINGNKGINKRQTIVLEDNKDKSNAADDMSNTKRFKIRNPNTFDSSGKTGIRPTSIPIEDYRDECNSHLNIAASIDPSLDIIKNQEDKINMLNNQIKNLKSAIASKDSMLNDLRLQVELLSSSNLAVDSEYVKAFCKEGLKIVSELKGMQPDSKANDLEVKKLKLEIQHLKNIIEELTNRIRFNSST